MSGPLIEDGRVLWAPPPARIVDEVHPGLFLGGSWQPYERAGRFDAELDCRFFPDDDTTPPNLAEMVESVVASVRAGHRTLVRCHLGLNRSALVAGLALRELTGRPGAQVTAKLRKARSPHVLCNPLFAEVVGTATGDGWTRCTDGHQHWGRFGAAGLLLAAGGRVLLQRRAPWSDHGGTWSLPGGARNGWESAAEAALREAAEETCIEAGAVRLSPAELSAACGGWRYTTVLGRLAEPAPASGGQEGTVRWVRLEEVPRLPLHPGLAATWPVLRNLLSGLGRSAAPARLGERAQYLESEVAKRDDEQHPGCPPNHRAQIPTHLTRTLHVVPPAASR